MAIEVSLSDAHTTSPSPHVQDGSGPRCTTGITCDHVTTKSFRITFQVITFKFPETHVSTGSSTRTSSLISVTSSYTNHTPSTSSVSEGTLTTTPDIPQSATSRTQSSSSPSSPSSFSKKSSGPISAPTVTNLPSSSSPDS